MITPKEYSKFCKNFLYKQSLSIAKLQEEIFALEIEINKEKQNTYAYLTVEEVEKYLLSKVFEDTDDIKVRKILVNTFIREIIWYGNEIIITYNFTDGIPNTKITKENVISIEKQVESNSQPVISSLLCSCIFQQSTRLSRRLDILASSSKK